MYNWVFPINLHKNAYKLAPKVQTKIQCFGRTLGAKRLILVIKKPNKINWLYTELEITSINHCITVINPFMVLIYNSNMER